MKIFITVVICAYKRENFIIEALDSVLNQDLDRSFYEIIVVKSFKNNQIDEYALRNNVHLLFVDDEKYGIRLAEAIKVATGEIIVTLDDDDMMVSEKLSVIKAYFEEEAGVVALYNDFYFIDQDGKAIVVPLRLKESEVMQRSGMVRLSGSSISVIRYCSKVGMVFGQMSVRKHLITDHLEYLEKLNLSLDTFLFTLVILSKMQFLVIPKKLTQVRVHPHGETQYFSNDIDLNKRINNAKKLIEDYNMMIEMLHYDKNDALEKVILRLKYYSETLVAMLHPKKIRYFFMSVSMRRIINDFQGGRIFGFREFCRECLSLTCLIIMFNLFPARISKNLHRNPFS